MAERFIVEVGGGTGRLYSVEAETASAAVRAVLERLGDRATWEGECLVWSTGVYAALHGAAPAGVVAL